MRLYLYTEHGYWRWKTSVCFCWLDTVKKLLIVAVAVVAALERVENVFMVKARRKCSCED